MARVFCVPALFFIFAAFVLLFIVSISLPYLTAMDITRVHTNTGSASALSGNDTTTELRFGIWAYCYDLANGNRVCSNTGHGYSVTVSNTQGNSVTIGSSWTRGLAVHPVAAGVSFIALLLALSQHITMTLFASLVSFIAALLTFIAFIIDIALYAYVKNQMENLGFSSGDTITGPGFWLTFTAMLLLLLGGCTVCFGRRRDRMANATPAASSSPKDGFFSRFKRN
ncbi:actin cortical patch SUR7/pH-response regulator pali [Scleroderma yunnanense]